MSCKGCISASSFNVSGDIVSPTVTYANGEPIYTDATLYSVKAMQVNPLRTDTSEVFEFNQEVSIQKNSWVIRNISSQTITAKMKFVIGTDEHEIRGIRNYKPTEFPRKYLVLDTIIRDNQTLPTVIPGDSDADAWIARLTSPTQIEQDAIQTFVVAEKADGNWSLYDEFWAFPMGATNGLVGAKSKTATAFGGVTWDANGVVCNGTNAYLNTNFTPTIDAVNYSLNDALLTAFNYSSTGLGNNTLIGSVDTGTSAFGVLQSNFNNGQIRGFINSSGDVRDSTPLSTNQLIAAERTDSSSMELYINGSTVATDTDSSTSLSNESFYIGARNFEGTEDNLFIGTISTALISAGVGFDHAAHNTNVRQLLTDLGVTL